MGQEDQKQQNKLAVIITSLVMLVVLSFLGIAIYRSVSGTTNTDSTTSTGTGGTPTVAATIPDPYADTTSSKPKTLLSQSGNGSSQTKSFTADSNWTVAYTYNCSGVGGTGNFQFDVGNPDGSYNTDIGANELGASGGNTDYYYDAGTHYLEINSECSWHVTVKG